MVGWLVGWLVYIGIEGQGHGHARLESHHLIAWHGILGVAVLGTISTRTPSPFVSTQPTNAGLHYLQPAADIVNDLVRARLAAKVRRQQPALLEARIDSLVDARRGLLLALELEHQRRGPDGRNGVRDALALNIRRAAVAGLADDKVLADVGGGHEAQRADQRGGTVGQDVAVQVGRDDDVVVARLAEQLVDHGVDNLLLDADGAVLRLREGLAGRLAEQAVGLAQHVALVRDCDERLLMDAGCAGIAHALAPQRNVAGHLGDVPRRRLGDALDGLGNLGTVGRRVRLLLLDVQVLCVLTHNDQVDGRLGRRNALDGAHVGVQGEALAEGDDGRRVAFCRDGWRRHGAEEGAVAVGLEGFDGRIGERDALLLERVPAGFVVREAELQAE
jgi:hypothetical protein